MSEIIQIPNSINLELSTLLFGQNLDFESGKFTLEDLKNFLDNYFSNSNGGGSGSSSIYVGSIPPASPTDGAKWVETDEMGMFVNEWTFAWLGVGYSWICPSKFNISGIISSTTIYSMPIIESFDYLIKEFNISYRLMTGSFNQSSYYSFELYHSKDNILTYNSLHTHTQDQYTATLSYSYQEKNINKLISPDATPLSFRDSPNSSQSLSLRAVRNSSIAVALSFYAEINYFKIYKA